MHAVWQAMSQRHQRSYEDARALAAANAVPARWRVHPGRVGTPKWIFRHRSAEAPDQLPGSHLFSQPLEAVLYVLRFSVLSSFFACTSTALLRPTTHAICLTPGENHTKIRQKETGKSQTSQQDPSRMHLTFTWTPRSLLSFSVRRSVSMVLCITYAVESLSSKA